MITNVKTWAHSTTGAVTTNFTIGKLNYAISGDHSSAEAIAKLNADIAANKYEQGAVFEPTVRQLKTPRVNPDGTTTTEFMAPMTILLQPILSAAFAAFNAKMEAAAIDAVVTRTEAVEAGEVVARVSVGDAQRALIDAKLAARKKAREAAAVAAIQATPATTATTTGIVTPPQASTTAPVTETVVAPEATITA